MTQVATLNNSKMDFAKFLVNNMTVTIDQRVDHRLNHYSHYSGWEERITPVFLDEIQQGRFEVHENVLAVSYYFLVHKEIDIQGETFNLKNKVYAETGKLIVDKEKWQHLLQKEDRIIENINGIWVQTYPALKDTPHAIDIVLKNVPA